MQYAASFASIGVIIILIAYTAQQANKVSPFTNSQLTRPPERLPVSIHESEESDSSAGVSVLHD